MYAKNAAKLKLLFVLPILAVIAVSGCTSGGGSVSGNGVVILDFRPDFLQVFSGDPVKLQVKVQNQGEARARDVKTELTGIDLTEWQTLGTSFMNENIGDLLPFDPAANTAGETKINSFSLRAPVLAKGIRFVYTPIIKVSYDYATTAQKSITIVDQDELRRIQQQGGTLPTGSTTFTKGPLSVEIETENYVKTGGSGFSSETFDIFPVHITITNLRVGNGVPIADSLGLGGGGLFTDFDYPIRVRVTPPSGTTFVSSGLGGHDDCTSGEVTKDMWQGSTAEITCELEVNNPPSFREERLLMVEVLYRYQSEASTQLTVFGTQQPSGFFW